MMDCNHRFGSLDAIVVRIPFLVLLLLMFVADDVYALPGRRGWRFWYVHTYLVALVNPSVNSHLTNSGKRRQTGISTHPPPLDDPRMLQTRNRHNVPRRRTQTHRPQPRLPLPHRSPASTRPPRPPNALLPTHPQNASRADLRRHRSVPDRVRGGARPARCLGADL